MSTSTETLLEMTDRVLADTYRGKCERALDENQYGVLVCNRPAVVTEFIWQDHNDGIFYLNFEETVCERCRNV